MSSWKLNFLQNIFFCTNEPKDLYDCLHKEVINRKVNLLGFGPIVDRTVAINQGKNGFFFHFQEIGKNQDCKA